MRAGTSIAARTEQVFVQTVALAVKEGWTKEEARHRDARPMYKTGWLEGMARAWTMMTGETSWALYQSVNQVLGSSIPGKAGSGWQLEEGLT